MPHLPEKFFICRKSTTPNMNCTNFETKLFPTLVRACFSPLPSSAIPYNHRIKDDRMVHISSSSQNSIAARKNVLADGR